MGEWTGDPRLEAAARETATALRARRGDDLLWRQDDDYRGLGTLHGVAGNTLVLLRFEADDALAAETAAVLAQNGVPRRRPRELAGLTASTARATA